MCCYQHCFINAFAVFRYPYLLVTSTSYKDGYKPRSFSSISKATFGRESTDTHVLSSYMYVFIYASADWVICMFLSMRLLIELQYVCFHLLISP